MLFDARLAMVVHGTIEIQKNLVLNEARVIARRLHTVTSRFVGGKLKVGLPEAVVPRRTKNYHRRVFRTPILHRRWANP